MVTGYAGTATPKGWAVWMVEIDISSVLVLCVAFKLVLRTVGGWSAALYRHT